MYCHQEWRDCQRLLNPQGTNGLNRRVLDFNIEQVHPEIAARSKAMLEEEDLSLEKVQAVSSGAGTFWVWVRHLCIITTVFSFIWENVNISFIDKKSFASGHLLGEGQ